MYDNDVETHGPWSMTIQECDKLSTCIYYVYALSPYTAATRKTYWDNVSNGDIVYCSLLLEDLIHPHRLFSKGALVSILEDIDSLR